MVNLWQPEVAMPHKVSIVIQFAAINYSALYFFSKVLQLLSGETLDIQLLFVFIYYLLLKHSTSNLKVVLQPVPFVFITLELNISLL